MMDLYVRFLKLTCGVQLNSKPKFDLINAIPFNLLLQVSRQAKQLLALMVPRPLLNIERLNPALFKFVVELREVKVLYHAEIVECILQPS